MADGKEGSAEGAGKARPAVVVGALIEGAEGNVFLAKSPKWSNKWIIPGGHVEQGERLEDAVAREVKEETGIEVKPVHILLVKDCIYPKNYHKKAHFVLVDYLCKAVGGKEEIDNKELTEYVWVRPDEALKALDVEEYSAPAVETFLKLRRFSDDVVKSAKGAAERAKGGAV